MTSAGKSTIGSNRVNIPVASKSHRQSSGASAVLGLDNLVTTELDTCRPD